MNCFLTKRLLSSYHYSRDPVIGYLSLLRTLHHLSAGYNCRPNEVTQCRQDKHHPQTNSLSPCIQARYSPQKNTFTSCEQPRRYLHVSRVKFRSNTKHYENKRKLKHLKKWSYVKSGMTVDEVADKLHVPVDDVLSSLLAITEQEYHAEDEVNSEDVLEKVGLMLNRNVKIAKEKKSSVVTPATPVKQTEVKVTKEPVDNDIKRQGPPDPKSLVSRPPVVTIMGHVDHGKTTLLDALREASVVDQEFGGITQHIGAFNVKLPSGHSITFLDTPGHAAFTAMRARGASVTDIVVLVIAAEDGIMPQTVESIQHARGENVPLVVAINKIDKFEADVEKTKNMLAAYDVVLEEYGGEVQAVPISALKRINLDQLEECITTLAEFLELKGDPAGLVEGRIIETRTDTGRGKMATILVQRGSLKKGDYLIAGLSWTKVRNMYDSNGQIVEKATPSTPVEIGGWKQLPQIGDEVLQAQTEKQLKKALAYRQEKLDAEKGEQDMQIINERRTEDRKQYLKIKKERAQYMRERGLRSVKRMNLVRFERIMNFNKSPQERKEIVEEKPTFYLIIKGDVAGSVEAITDTLATFQSNLCDIEILHSGVGDVTPYDIELAELFDGLIYAFNVSPITHESVAIKNHNVIYHLFDDLIQTINEKLPFITEEIVRGEAKILQEFLYKEKKKDGNRQIHVAGCRCLSGNLSRKYLFKLQRGDEVIFDGKLSSLKIVKDEVSSVGTNQECGMTFGSETDVEFKPGDTVICYEAIQKQPKLDWEPGYVADSSKGFSY